MRYFRTTVQCLSGIILAIIAFPAICLAVETVRINGSGSALDMMKPIIAAFQKTNKGVRVIMEKPLGSSGAVKALLDGALDLAVSSKPLKPEEAAKGALLRPYGKTALVIIVEKKVPKTDITSKELEEIHTGKHATWSNGEPVRLIMRPREDVDSTILGSLSPAMANAIELARSRPGMIVAVTDPESYRAVSNTPGGLGATGMTSLITEKLPVVALTLNGIKPSLTTVASGAYPLAKEINIVTTPTTLPATQKLISFLHSPQGRVIAAKTGVFVTDGIKSSK